MRTSGLWTIGVAAKWVMPASGSGNFPCSYILIGLTWVNANPYTSNMQSLVPRRPLCRPTTILRWMREVPEDLTSRSFETTPDVHGYLALLADVLTEIQLSC